MIDFLLSEDMNASACILDAKGRSPLFLASMKGHAQIVKRLLKAEKEQECSADMVSRKGRA